MYVVPSLHATWHSVFVFLVHSDLRGGEPIVHVAAAAHVSHGALPDAEKVAPALHATWQTVSAVIVHDVLTPVAHV